jgi:hypothetical protein
VSLHREAHLTIFLVFFSIFFPNYPVGHYLFFSLEPVAPRFSFSRKTPTICATHPWSATTTFPHPGHPGFEFGL